MSKPHCPIHRRFKTFRSMRPMCYINFVISRSPKLWLLTGSQHWFGDTLHHNSHLSCSIASDKLGVRHFEAEVGVPAIIMDAQDWGLVKRPRVFWTDAGWQRFGETAMGWTIRWTKLYDTDHLTFEFPRPSGIHSAPPVEAPEVPRRGQNPADPDIPGTRP